MNSSELLLHPVRLRIVQAFLGDRTLTTAQLAEELSDVPTATLYRHVSLLSNAGVLEVVSERRVRGGVERTLALRVDAARVTPDELATLSTEQHAAMFRAYIAHLLTAFDEYLAAGAPDLVADGAGYSMSGLWLSDAEFAELGAELGQVFASRIGNTPTDDRRLRMFASVVIPQDVPRNEG
ncbi:helix-turn-helix domain-containing protein [Leifsonia sp. PS1209]|uniref:helix-turn-helix domain-containing protein n=1 Tax=Leifsonia sp. PS1209 TaxID=2724914 RepID=UPI001442BB9D|nr:helix-turn-helix domain-containing protein [Leifsonia sp. PS1209]QIZ98900.1 helix-turn-helix domain-containing protein [Leifsonia sp. PS1209]